VQLQKVNTAVPPLSSPSFIGYNYEVWNLIKMVAVPIISNSAKEAGRKSWNFVKDNAISLGLGTTLALSGYFIDKNVSSAKAENFWGVDITNTVQNQGWFSTYFDVIHWDNPGVSEGDDSYDIPFIFDYLEPGTPGLYSEIPGWKFGYECKPWGSNTPFNIKMFYYGFVDANSENHLLMDFYTGVPPEPNEPFGNKPVIFESDRLLYGSAVDIRKAIDKAKPNVADIRLKNLTQGNYDQYTPYGSAILKIGTKFLGDLDNDKNVDFKDFSVLANDWKKPQGQYVGDISDANGIPDGYVNYYELEALSKDWCKDINDPNTY